MLAVILAAVTVAFPREGQRLPGLTRCYMIGATDGDEKSLVVQGRTVSVHRTGAWATLVDVVPGRNVIAVGDAVRTVYVASQPAARQPSGSAARSSVSEPQASYPKLPYASDRAVPPPIGKKPKNITIALDAGHGVNAPGALSPHGLQEKDANLRLAHEVCLALKAKGFRVLMTRTDDRDIPLYDRPKVAHARKVDAFVSIHHNAPGYSTDPSLCRYQSVYAWNAMGRRLAIAIERRMAAANPTLPSKGVLQANFVVMRSPEIPSCLIEADFITHPEGESAAWDPACRGRTAVAIADGIADWVAGK